jgi:hypothetical protein
MLSEKAEKRIRRNDMDTRDSIGRFLQENPGIGNEYTLTNGKLMDYEQEIGKSFFAFGEADLAAFFFDYLELDKMNTFHAYRRIYRRFYAWGMEQGVTGENYNILDSPCFASDTAAACMAAKDGLVYYDPVSLDLICGRISDSPEYTEAVIRCLYEGVPSLQDIVGLRREQIEEKEKKIRFGDREIPISDRLCRLLLYCLSEEALSGLEGKYPAVRFREDDVFAYAIVQDSDKNRYQFLKRKIEKVSRELKLRAFTPKNIYLSGLLQFIYQACGKDRETFVQLLWAGKWERDGRLGELLKKGGYRVTAARVRYMCKPYREIWENANACSKKLLTEEEKGGIL